MSRRELPQVVPQVVLSRDLKQWIQNHISMNGGEVSESSLRRLERYMQLNDIRPPTSASRRNHVRGEPL